MNKVNGWIQGETHNNTFISTCIYTCEKDIYHTSDMKSQIEVDLLERPSDHNTLLENACTAREISLESIWNQYQLDCSEEKDKDSKK